MVIIPIDSCTHPLKLGLSCILFEKLRQLCSNSLKLSLQREPVPWNDLNEWEKSSINIITIYLVFPYENVIKIHLSSFKLVHIILQIYLNQFTEQFLRRSSLVFNDHGKSSSMNHFQPPMLVLRSAHLYGKQRESASNPRVA